MRLLDLSTDTAPLDVDAVAREWAIMVEQYRHDADVIAEGLATDEEMWEGIQGPHAFERADYDEVRGDCDQ